MNKLLVVLFGLVVAAHSFTLPTSRDALLEHSFNVGSSSEDSAPTEASADHSHSEVLPVEDHSEDQPDESQPLESSQAEESHQDAPAEATQPEESHQDAPAEAPHAEESHSEDKPAESSQAEEPHSEDKPAETSQPEEPHSEDKPVEASQPEESHQDAPAEAPHAEESHSEDKPAESSQTEEPHSEDKPAEASQPEESHQDKPAESQPAESSQAEEPHSEDKPAENPLANDLLVEDLHEENSDAQDDLNEDKHEEDSSKKEEEEAKEVEDKKEDQDLPSNHYEDQALNAVSNGLYRFSSDFYKKTAATRTRNLVCSPLSVGVLLAMTAQGARGLTEKEMRKGLHLPEDTLASRNGYQTLIDSLNAEKKAEVHFANAVFMNDMIEMTPEFESITKDYFRSPVEKVPFYFPDEASEVINYWVEERTNGKVKNVVKPEDAFDSEMVLVNAVYFKGSWQLKFDPKNTEQKLFNIDNRQFKKVPTMYQKNTFNYGVLPQHHSVYVELPYENLNDDDEMSMFIVLPNEVTGLKKLINASEKINFQELHSKPQLTSVKLSMPKFKVRSTLKLQGVLEKMGMRDMFRHKANFTGITTSRHLSLTKVVQKAYLEVNEEGSEAAAATAAILNLLSASPSHEEPVEVRVDHPFMYVIYHCATNTVLFQGHVKAPALR